MDGESDEETSEEDDVIGVGIVGIGGAVRDSEIGLRLLERIGSRFQRQLVKHVETTLCLKKRPTFTTCYNFYIHSSIVTIFGINVAEKVGN